jgi:transcriptional antiterminator NusG
MPEDLSTPDSPTTPVPESHEEPAPPEPETSIPTEGEADGIAAEEPSPAPKPKAQTTPEEPVAEAGSEEESGEPAAEEEAAGEGEEPAAEAAPAAPSNKNWYVVKVQSGREESIKEAIERRVKIEGLEEYFGQIIIPVERVTEMRNSKRVTRTRKLYPGYLMCEVEFNDRILYLFRETSGVGDFVGGGVNRPPPPMPAREVEAMLGRQGEQKPGVQVSKPKWSASPSSTGATGCGSRRGRLPAWRARLRNCSRPATSCVWS